jgi:hypothetical protein
MKNLNFIKFYSFPLLFNQSKEKICFGKIRSIELMRELKSFSSIEILKKIFPQIERLQMKIKSNEDIHHILNSFSNSLSIVQFYFETSNITITEKSIEKTLGHHNFTFSNHPDSIRLWIGSNNVCFFFIFLLYYYLYYFSLNVNLTLKKNEKSDAFPGVLQENS